MKRPALLIAPLLFMIFVPWGEGRCSTPDLGQVVRKIQAVYSQHCCFSARFDQLTVNVAMDMNDRFQGVMYVRKPGAIALDVQAPEKQKVVLKGRNYTVYFPEDGNAAHGEIPPEINVEHFFGFFANIGNLDKNFTIQFPPKSADEQERMIFLELNDIKSPQSSFRIILGVDSDRFIVRRAVIYDALGNYNRFDLFDVTFLKSIPDSVFKAAPGPAEIVAPNRTAPSGSSEKK